MAQQQRPFVADPNEWEVIDEDEYEVVEEQPAKAQTWSDRLGLNEPTESVGVGFLRGSGAGLVDMLQGAVSNVTGQMNAKLDAENAVGAAHGGRQVATLPRVEQPDNFSGTVGGVLPVAGEMALGGVPAGRQIARSIPSATRAGARFQEVMGAAQDVVVDAAEMGDKALRIQQLAERGGSMPKSVRDLLRRLTDPEKPAMAYRESRDFASNISRLSADEYSRLTPVMAREVAELSAAMNKANATAARSVGKGAEYKAAMREYARAMDIKDAIDTAVKGAKRAALPAAGIGGAAYWMTGKLQSLLGGE